MSWILPISLSLLSQAVLPIFTKRDVSHLKMRLRLFDKWRILPSLCKLCSSLPQACVSSDPYINLHNDDYVYAFIDHAYTESKWALESADLGGP